MYRRIFVILFTFSASSALFYSCGAGENPCQDIECSNQGTCHFESSVVWCECFDGFQASGLSCLRIQSDADHDELHDSDTEGPDSDPDTDPDRETDPDADPDTDIDPDVEVLFEEDFEDGLEGWTNVNEMAVWTSFGGIITSGTSCWPGVCDEGMAILASEATFEIPEDGRFTIEFDLMTDYAIVNYSIVELMLQNADVQVTYEKDNIQNLDRLIHYFLDTRFSTMGRGNDLLYILPDQWGRGECWHHDWQYFIGSWIRVRLGVCGAEGYTLEILEADSREVLHSFSSLFNTIAPDDMESVSVVLSARGHRKNIDNIRITSGCTWFTTGELNDNCTYLPY